MTDVKGAYFDLNGKMLNKSQKGLNILNGKKVVVK